MAIGVCAFALCGAIFALWRLFLIACVESVRASPPEKGFYKEEEKRMDKKTALFSFIRSAILQTEVSEEVLAFCQEAKVLDEICSIAQGHDLLHLIATCLEQNKAFKKTDAYPKIQQQFLTAVYRYEQTHYALEDACRILELAAIPHAPLKGSVLRVYYPQPWLRTSCDIDVLIHPEDVERAISALCDSGYVRQADATLHDCLLQTPNGVHLELHYSLKQEGLPRTDELLEAAWEHCTVKGETACRYEMSPEMFVFYHTAHMAKHFMLGGCGIRPFVDLWLLNRKMPFDGDALRAMLGQAELLDFYQAAVKLSAVWMENEPHDARTKPMEQFVLAGGVYGTMSNSATVKAARGEGRLKTFFKLVFLPRANLEILYPNLKRRPLLLPFYQVKRWFGFFNKEKRRTLFRLTAARNSVQNDMRDRVEEMLIDLRLK